jgi:hypothetical protein
MANRNFPHGFAAIETLHGGPIFTMPYPTVAAYATALKGGDAVMQATDGNINRFGTPGTDRLSGVIAHSRPASVDLDVLVYDDPGIIFEIQDDGSAGPVSGVGFQKTERGLNANILKGAGDSVRDCSTDQLDATTLAVTASLDLRVLGKVDDPSNNYGANCRVRVLINKHRFNRETAGI